ncbi:MAG: O-antigen ligase family protein [Candidatus Falkowbacteria bacterium]
MKSIKLGEFSFKKVLEMLIEATYLSVFFAIPLAMAFFLATDNVFELNKIVLFRSLIYILFSLTLAKALFFPSKQRFSLRYLVPVLALLIFGAFSLFFSTDPTNSYYGLNDRQQGYRSLLFYAWWFFLLLYNLATADDFDNKISKIFWVIMGSSFLVSLYGILQILGIDFIAWTEPAFVTYRTTSTLGQPNYLGSYLILVIPLVIYGLMKYRQLWPRFILSIILLSQLITLITTGSRSAWLGLLVALALVVFWTLYRFWPKISAARRRGAILIIILSLAVTALLLSQNNYISERFKSTFDFQHGSVSVRFNFWSGALESISKKPLLGYGIENQGREFIKYYQADWAKTGFVNASTNRAHNLILDILLTVGIIGLIFYVWVYTSFFRWANKIRADKKYCLLSEVIIASVLAYLISLLFGFSVVVTEIYFWSYFAIIVAISTRLDGTAESDLKMRLNKWFKIGLIILALIFSFRQISNDFKVLAADNYFLEVRQVLTQNDYPKALFYYQKIKELGVYNFNYDYYLVDSLPYDLNTAISPVIANLAQKEVKDILPTLARDDYNHYYLKAKIYTLLKDYPRAEEAYQKMIEISPNLPKNYFARAKFYVVFQKDDLALIDLEKTLELLPAPENYPESLSTSEKSVAFYRSLVLKEMGDLYFRQQKYDLADENYRASYLLNLKDLATYKKIADSYFMQGDLKSAIWYNLRAGERHPNDYVWPFSLSFLYNQQGDYENAVKYLDLAITLDTQKIISVEMIDSIKKKSN